MKTAASGRHDAEQRGLVALAWIFFPSLPDGEDPAEIVHDVVEFNLQVFQDLAGLLTQLQSGDGDTVRTNTCSL